MSRNYDNYLDMLMRNYPLASDSSDEAKEFRHLRIKNATNKKSRKTSNRSKIMKGGLTETTTDTASETSSVSSTESGIGQGDVPYGGFPPIFLCKTSVEIKDAEKKEREYIKKTTAVSIQDIMKKRRDVVPFLSI